MGRKASVRFLMTRPWLWPLGLALAVAAAALLRPSIPPEPTGGLEQLPAETAQRLRHAGGTLAAEIALFVSHAELVSELWSRQGAHALEEEELECFSENASAWAEAILRECAGAVRGAGVRESLARRELSRLLGETCRPVRLSPPVVPLRAGFLSSCGSGEAAPGPILGILLEVLSRLEALLEEVPPNSRAARGLRSAIGALRRLLGIFDAEPVVIAFTAPAEGALARSIPEIEFTMTDAGSGPDPASRRLIAVHTGPMAGGTTDLTARTSFTADPGGGRGVVRAEGLEPSALADGFLRLEASGTDLAGNPPATAVRNFVLDRQSPAILMARPESGEEFSSPTAPLEVTLTDAVSGVDLASVTITLDEAEITSSVTAEVISATPLGHPREVRLTGSLEVAPGAHEVSIRLADRAGNEAQARIRFTVSGAPPPPPEVEIEQDPVATLEKIQPEDPHADFEGGYAHKVSGTLRLRVRGAEGPLAGIRLLARLLDGEGRIVPAPDLPMVTNEEGIGGFAVEFGRKVGPHTVEVTASNAVVAQPLRFTVEALEFPLMVTVVTDHRAGSGAILEIHTPQGTSIRAFESDAQGNPVPAGRGKVIVLDPEITSWGESDRLRVLDTGRMGYLIKPGVTGSYFMTVEAVGLTDENGNPIRRTIPLSVPEIPSGPQPLPQARIVSGQGQRGYPGRETPEPLVAALIPGTQPSPHDRIVFSVATSVGLGGSSFPAGELVAVTGADPILRGPGRLSLRAVGGVASVRFIPAFPVSAAITIGVDAEPEPLPPNDYFLVAAPRVYLARKKLPRDAAGRVLRDAQGNTAPSDEFEEIPEEGRGPEPFVRVGDILDRAGRLKEPREVYAFYVEMETKDFGERLPAGVMAADILGKPLELQESLAPSILDLELQRVKVEEGRAFYRSGPLSLTFSARKREETPVHSLPGGARLLQGKIRSTVVPYVPYRGLLGGTGRYPSPGRPGRSPMWVFLGDSLTIGTQGKCVVRDYQESSYAVQACRLANVRWAVAGLEEPGTPQRIWTDPVPGAALVPDPTRPPRTDPTLFAALMGGLSEPAGGRLRAVGERAGDRRDGDPAGDHAGPVQQRRFGNGFGSRRARQLHVGLHAGGLGGNGGGRVRLAERVGMAAGAGGAPAQP